MLGILAFAGLTIVIAMDSVTVAALQTACWGIVMIVGLRRVFARKRLGATLALTSAFWLAMSMAFAFHVHRERLDAAEKHANQPALMEESYRRGAAFLEQGDSAAALEYLEQVEKIDPEYKDLWELLTMARQQEDAKRVEVLVAEAEALPANEVLRLSEIYDELAELRPDEALYRQRADTYRQRKEEKLEQQRKAQDQLRQAEEEWQQAEEERRQAEALQKAEERERRAAERRRQSLARQRQFQLDERERAAAQLHLWRFDWKVADGYAQASGRVENVTEWPFENLEARVRYWNAAGTVVLTDACVMVETPLLPRKSSSFRCVKEAVAGIVSADVSFATVHGSPLAHYDRTGR